MSGGVDSSAAAHLLLEAGHEVIGVFMRHGAESPVACELPESPSHSLTSDSGAPTSALPIVESRLDHKQGCCSASDARDAARVADRLGIPFYALNLNREFDRIIDYFTAEYAAGRTPNPCVMCNNWIKFGKLFDYADSVGAEFVATGHYAHLTDKGQPTPALRRGVDDAKDQSYVLFGIRRELLPRMLLPVGTFEKPQIRALAAEVGLNTATKKDSQEICFVTSGKHGEFVRAAADPSAPPAEGDIVTTTGERVGRHRGIENYTIGQRKGLGVALGEPYFVTHIDAAENRVVLGRKEDLARSELTAGRTNWLIDPPPAAPFRCEAQIRYNSPAAPAVVELCGEDSSGSDRFRVTFDEPRYGVAPGQAVVLYEEDRVLGGGWIE
jgi:tRNA-specific 2-thiouridylase